MKKSKKLMGITEIRKFKFEPDDFILVTIGDLKSGLIPSKEDLKNWRDLLQEIFKEQTFILCPPIVKMHILDHGSELSIKNNEKVFLPTIIRKRK